MLSPSWGRKLQERGQALWEAKGPGLVPEGQRGTVRGFIRNDRIPAALGGQFEAGGRVGV